QYYFYINQSKNATAGLDNGTYTYQVSAKNLSNIESLTEERTITIGEIITPPIINVISPANTTYTTSTIWFNASINEPASAWIVNYNGTNVTLSNINTSLTVEDGTHQLLLYANDSDGTWGLNDSIYFTVQNCNPPESGDWTITSDQTCSNREITISGHLNITSGNELTLNNVTLYINQTVDYDRDIIVENGANLTAYGNTKINETGDNNYVYLINYGMENFTGSKTSNRIRHANDYATSISYITNTSVDYEYFCRDSTAICVTKNSNLTYGYVYIEDGVSVNITNVNSTVPVNANITSSTNAFVFNLSNTMITYFYLYNNGGDVNLTDSDILFFYHYNYNNDDSYIKNSIINYVNYRHAQSDTSVLLEDIRSPANNVNMQTLSGSTNIFNLSGVNYSHFRTENSYTINITNSSQELYYGYANSNANLTDVNFSYIFRLYDNAQASLQNAILDSSEYSLFYAGTYANFVKSKTPNRIDKFWLYQDGTVKIGGYVNINDLYEAWTDTDRYVNRVFPFNVTSLSGSQVSNVNVSIRNGDNVLNSGLSNSDGIADVNYTDNANNSYEVYLDGVYKKNVSILENTYPNGIAVTSIESPASSKFNIQNNTGGTVASIDSVGNMYIKGTATQSQSSLSPSANAFIIQNNTGTTVAYVSSAGSLYLKGTISTNSDLSGQTSSNLEIQNSTGSIVAFFDNTGNLKLKGGIAENYANP
ncbi:MAG: hypothetical protein Q8N88_07050, partial [Nanoarchaeota archaeon]|nr:hypothetical protein [Nanoarchaeota archaeon]